MPEPLLLLIIGALLLALTTFLFYPNGGLIHFFSRINRLSSKELREDALKHLHKLERNNEGSTVEDLKGVLNIGSTKALAILTDLKNRELVIVDGGIYKLTPTGTSYALRVIRAHRLWERYLADETGHKESKWHEIADHYEHQISPEEANQIAAQLGYPTHDYHGDPIPNANGMMIEHGGQPLTSMDLGHPLRIVHLEDEPETVYAQLVAEGLHPGMEVQLTEINPQRVCFWDDGGEHVLAPFIAENISVVPISNDEQEISCSGSPLHSLNPGEKGEVLSLSPRLRGVERRRLMDLGILPGTLIKAELSSPSGEPTAYRIRGALIALRKEQSDLICITPHPENSI